MNSLGSQQRANEHRVIRCHLGPIARRSSGPIRGKRGVIRAHKGGKYGVIRVHKGAKQGVLTAHKGVVKDRQMNMRLSTNIYSSQTHNNTVLTSARCGV